MEQTITLDEIQEHSKFHGQRKTSLLLSALGKQSQFIKAWDTPAGKQILTSMVNDLDGLINDILFGTDEKDLMPVIKICRSYAKTILNHSSIINSYERNLKSLKEPKAKKEKKNA